MNDEDVARGLHASFLSVPEPRSDRGRRHPLAATLTLVVLAGLDGARSPKAVADWGRRQSSTLIAAMGFPHSLTASGSTIRNLRRRVTVDEVVSTVKDWIDLSGSPESFDLQIDPAAPFGFYVRRLDQPVLLSSGDAAPVGKAVKHPSQLRRWRRRA
jgi:hypothetical protein